MSLFLPLSADQYHAKPMAISSITSPAGVDSTTTIQYNNSPSTVCHSPSSSSTHSDSATPPSVSSKSTSLSPQNHSFSHYSTSSTSSFQSSSSNNQNCSSDIAISVDSSSPYYHSYHYTNNEDCASGSNITSQTSAPLSLHERRQRNKTASAKYRAKKNQQQGEMRVMISSLTKENELLLRQLNHIQHENSHLKSTCDRLRGKLMAQKMLKQYLVEFEQQVKSSSGRSVSNDPASVEDNYFSHYNTHEIGHQKYPESEQDKTAHKEAFV